MLKLSIAQINPTVGDLDGNVRKILEYVERAQKAGAALVVFPELVICGYPPEDLLLKKHFVADNIKALDALVRKVRGISAIVGFVDSDGEGRIYNAAALIDEGKLQHVYHKQELPNYGVFDEKRYFSAGKNAGVVTINGAKAGINICEDIWVDGAVYQQQAKVGTKVLINISSSPFHAGKLKEREELLLRRARETKTPLVYVNTVGGQDELVFDGGSMVVSAEGKVLARAKQFEEQLLTVSLSDKENTTSDPGLLDEAQEIYTALVVGTRDYVFKNGFKKVALGLSGGVDSALVACIACDAIGAENVTGVSMPGPFNSKATIQDAKILAKNLKIKLKEIPIRRVFAAYLKTVAPYFAGLKTDSTEENIQARVRGNLLMALANKFGGLILTTGNKSEMAVGYCTLYGDMSGGYAVIKDVFKTKVYELARYRNSISRQEVIPKSVLLRAPSAELRPHQTDEEALGAYEDLDKILKAYIEEHASPQDIIAAGMNAKMVERTVHLVDMNEYKRRQAPPGVKITPCAFGKDWRLPITNRYKE
jgi:NAD+ synthase (glutamine-hydrolysing)